MNAAATSCALLVLLPATFIAVIAGGGEDCPPEGATVTVNVEALPEFEDAALSSDPAVRTEQVRNAALIVNAGAAHGQRAQEIGVMVGLGESSLVNLDHGDEGAGVTNPDGSPTCSVGVFQQQWCLGGYGTREQAMDPTFAATTFFTRLAQLPGWQDHEPTLAAHKVQRNADPRHYEKYYDGAVRIVQALTGAAVPPGCEPDEPEYFGPGGWGGFSNGRIPASSLAPIPWAPSERLRADATHALTAMNNAYVVAFGKNIAITDSYRDYDAQVRLKAQKPTLAGTPGTSNHGWGLALDLGGGINTFGTAEHNWMRVNAPTYGWALPAWAQAGGSKPEPWHWEYVGSAS